MPNELLKPSWADDTIATLLLSGTEIKVGMSSSHSEESIFIVTDEIDEPVYVSVIEAKLLIAALEAAVGAAESVTR